MIAKTCVAIFATFTTFCERFVAEDEEENQEIAQHQEEEVFEEKEVIEQRRII